MDRVLFRFSDHSGAISSLLHRVQLIPNEERRLDTMVDMVTSLLSLPPTNQRYHNSQLRGESF